MDIGEHIKLRRIELGMTQQELCDKMGYTHHSTITKIEKGLVDLSYSKIVQFASVLGVDVDYLTESSSDHSSSISKLPPLYIPSKTTVAPNKEELLNIILRLSTDSSFLKTVEMLHSLSHDQLTILQHFFETFILPQQNLEKQKTSQIPP